MLKRVYTFIGIVSHRKHDNKKTLDWNESPAAVSRREVNAPIYLSFLSYLINNGSWLFAIAQRLCVYSISDKIMR